MANPEGERNFAQAQIMKNDIPVYLSKLVLAGKEEQALQLLVDWGTHAKDNPTIWTEARALLQESDEHNQTRA